MNAPQAPNQRVIRVGWKRRIGGQGLGLLAGLVSLIRRGEPLGQRAVILEPYGMGDVISLEPLVRQLRGSDWQVTVAARPAWRELFPPGQADDWCDCVAPWSRYETGQKYRLGALFGPELRAARARLGAAAAGAVGIDPRGDSRSVLLLWLAGCRQVWSLGHYLGTDLAMPALAACRVGDGLARQRWQQNLDFFTALTQRPAAQSAPDLCHLVPTDLRPEAKRIALISVAPWRGKLWSPTKWQALIAALRTRGWQLTSLCGPHQAPETCAALGKQIPITECTSLPQWARELRRSRLVITLDTGPMHLAAALDVPVVALFGQGSLPLWAPAGPRSFVVTHQTDADFQPCHPLEENWAQGAQFMDRLTVAEVLQAAERALG